MPKAKIFDQLRQRLVKDDVRLPAEKRAMFWFKEYASALRTWQRKYQGASFGKLQREDFTKQMVGASKASPGFFYFFNYDAKTKDELPYWDKFPFVLVLHLYKDGFLGLNFHYLSYQDRARFFDALYRFREGRAARPTTRDIRMRLKVTYAILKVTTNLRAYKPCIKRYLSKHVRSSGLMKVGAKEWDLALFLPVAQFQKRSEPYVWRKSRELF